MLRCALAKPLKVAKALYPTVREMNVLQGSKYVRFERARGNFLGLLAGMLAPEQKRFGDEEKAVRERRAKGYDEIGRAGVLVGIEPAEGIEQLSVDGKGGTERLLREASHGNLLGAEETAGGVGTPRPVLLGLGVGEQHVARKRGCPGYLRGMS